ncbi:MAG: glycosyltransferase family 4 protein [Paludibacteraceae bacterium]|nr:glycosyltransferase family 4 protein [Paludibacteraceae bacterium]
MRILQLAGYFYPEQAASMYLEENRYQAFADNGFHTIVYTATPTRGITEKQYHEFKKIKHDYMYDGKLEVFRFKMFREGKNPILRALRYVFCWCAQFWKGLRAKDIDLIYLASTPPIQGVLGGLLKKIKKVPFVYNLQDIFPDSLVGTGLAKKGGLLWKIGRVIENFTYRNADKIIVISEDFKKNIMAKGVPEEKIVVIYNWVDEESVKNVPKEENKLFDRYNLDRNKFYITYCGNIGLTQNMDMLLEVAKELETELNIHFVLIGEGAYKEKVMKIMQEKQINNVTLLPFQPYEDISHVFSLGDIGLVISKQGVGETSVPSKTWSILSASRPVLVNFDENELKAIVNKYQCGIFTKAGDKTAFKEAILRLYQNRGLCSELGDNGRQFILKNLTRTAGTQKYVDVIKNISRTK